MKAIVALLAAAALACTSCGKSSGKDTDITGKWSANGEGFSGGYVFDSDGTADIYFLPGNTYFSGGDLFIAGIHISSSSLSYDGDILRADILGEEVLVLDRTGEPAPDTYDGDFILAGGSMRGQIASGMGIESPDSAELHFTVSGEKICITAVDVIDYTIDGSTLTFKGRNGIPDSSGDFELSGDTLSLTRSDGTKRIFSRAE